MSDFGAVKIRSKRRISVRPKTVAVIASIGELRAALRMRRQPDLFELRLDYLADLDPRKISKLGRPLIITARHPKEGGFSRALWPGGSRCALLLKFLPCAEFVDVELRSLRELRKVWNEAARLKIKRICSVHDFARTPPHGVLQKHSQHAKRAGADVFKLVTRADKLDDLITLLQFLRRAARSADGPQCCVMATGKLGPISRVLFPECGSVFAYAALQSSLYPGQLTWRELRRHLNP